MLTDLNATGLSFFSYGQFLVGYAIFSFIVSCGLSNKQVRQDLLDWRALGTSLVCKTLLAPVLALFVSLVFFASPVVGGAMLMMLVLPSVGTSMLLTWVAGGRLSLSFVLMVISNLLTFLLAPVSIWLMKALSPVSYAFIDLPDWYFQVTIGGCVFAMIVPCVLGFLVSSQLPGVAKRIHQNGMYMALAGFVVFPLVSLYLVFDIVLLSALKIGAHALLAYSLCLIVVYFVSASAGNNHYKSIPITFNVLCSSPILAGIMYFSVGNPMDEIAGVIAWWFVAQMYFGLICSLILRLQHHTNRRVLAV